jgi:NADPH:quinone reductase-like Zn-dependent oxidoreductase
VGEGVEPRRIGERVLVEPVFRGQEPFDVVYFGSEVDGGFADYCRAPAVHAHAVQSDLSDAELASFPCAYSAAENMLTRIGLAAGERVLITGASGGVGSAAVQLAKRRGAIVTAMAGEDKAAAVRALGADHVIPRKADLASLFAGNPFDAAVDVVGGSQFTEILKCLRSGGRYAAAGAIAGPIVELDLRTLYLKDLTLRGCTVLEPEVFPNLVGYIERSEIKPLLAETFPLFEIARAQEAFLTKQHVGKIVLTL